MESVSLRRCITRRNPTMSRSHVAELFHVGMRGERSKSIRRGGGFSKHLRSAAPWVCGDFIFVQLRQLPVLINMAARSAAVANQCSG